MKDADSLGSIMRFEISQDTREHLVEAVNAYDAEPKYTEAFKNLIDGFRLILALTENYHALVMNPPYMGGGNMNGVLSKYVKDNYENGKSDLATVFVEMMGQRTSVNGSYAFIIPPSWMFLSTFEGLRKTSSRIKALSLCFILAVVYLVQTSAHHLLSSRTPATLMPVELISAW